MAEQRFDPTHVVHFDVALGQIELQGASSRVLIPASSLLDLLLAAGDDLARDFGHRLGTEIGRRLSARFPNLKELSIAGMTDHLGGELALNGLGSLSVERWGQALVLKLKGSPLAEGGEYVLAAVLEGALQRALARDARAVFLAGDDDGLRFLFVSEGAAQKVESWLAGGASWPDALALLQQRSAS